MTVPTPGEEIKDPAPAPTPAPNADMDPKNPPVEADPKEPKDIDFDKDLEDLEAGTPAPKPGRTELEKAKFTMRSTAKRIKELGGDPSAIVADDEPAPVAPADTGEFVTKLDLAKTEAEKLAKSPGEVKVIMWYVKNKGLTVADAHILANKGKVSKVASEIARANAAVPSNGGGGAGERTPETKVHKMNEAQEKRLQMAGMSYDQATNAYTGKRTRVRHNGTAWIHERLVNGKWQAIPDASQFE